VQQREDHLKQIREPFDVLHDAKKLRWRFILSGDESWFFLVHEHQKLWFSSDANAPEVTRRLIKTPKVMITLFWNTSGFHISNFLAGESFNADDFVWNVLYLIHSPDFCSGS
jgi:hypothetical protein